MPFFLFLFLQSKEKERTAKKEKEKHANVSYALTSFGRVFSFCFAKISYARYCCCATRSQVYRRRVRSTVAGERVPVYRQQPFNPMPEGHCELLRVFSFFGYISFSLYRK